MCRMCLTDKNIHVPVYYMYACICLALYCRGWFCTMHGLSSCNVYVTGEYRHCCVHCVQNDNACTTEAPSGSNTHESSSQANASLNWTDCVVDRSAQQVYVFVCVHVHVGGCVVNMYMLIVCVLSIHVHVSGMLQDRL